MMMKPTQQPAAAVAMASNGSINEKKRLFITHVDAFGPYLKISGQPNPDAMAVVRSRIQQLLPTCYFYLPTGSVRHHFNAGVLCLYQRKNGAAPSDYEYLRTRILNVVAENSPTILQLEVEFIDYGYTAVVFSYELQFPPHPDPLQNIPPLCSTYIMLGICTDWKQSELDEILRMIAHQTLDICIKMEFNQFKFITMKWKEFNFAEFLIHQKKIGAPVANDLLRDNFIKIYTGGAAVANNNNYNTNNNNNVYTNNNNNNATLGANAIYVGGGGATHVREQMAAKRSLAARLQQHQMPGQNVVMNPVQPRMPHTIGNLRSMMQGINYQNTRIPYTGSNFQPPAVAAFNGIANMMPPATAYTRYQRPQPPQPLVADLPPQRRTTSATYKSNNLNVGNIYDVCVSFVENGPCLFSVQLASAQEELTEMMNLIERVQLKQFGDKPVLGTACIARYSEDGQLYRALITGVQPTACKVAYIDYGNAEVVNFRDLYEIPDEFLTSKPFAIRFTLSGHKELEPIDESLKKAFKDLVIYKNCKLKVMPLEGPPLVQYCELYLQEENILNVLKQIQKCRLVYAKAEPLQNNDIVEIRYIDSPKHFYVQKVSNIDHFEQLMDDMFLYYNKNQLVPNHLALGAPCIVKYEKEWYRAEVMRADSTAIIVRHVDFGYEQKVTKNLLSTIAEKHLKLPRQAVQCCLKGFENNELSKDLATTQFEMLAEESNSNRRSFVVKVFRIQPDGVNLVNLCTKDLNVMKKLYKLSMPFEQYLTLEKEAFNMHGQNGHHHKANENGQKTPSIASSNDVPSVMSSITGKNVNILNSTTMQSDERIQQQQQVQNLPKTQQQHYNNSHNNSQASFSTEWDKNSSASSMDNRDSRSSSSEHKRGKRQQQLLRQGLNVHNASFTSSSDRRSNGSIGSGGGGNNKSPRGSGGNNMAPRSQNNKQDNDNRRHTNKQQPQQRIQRPQNAPQGYSQQQRHKAGSSSNRSNDGLNSANEPQPPPQIPEEYVPLDRAFPTQHIDTPAREDVILCWWISPHQFYMHLRSRLPEFELLMREIQQFYKTKPLQQLQLKVGSYVIARFRKDNVLYRARVLGCNHMLRKYKVYFVDFGNQYTVTSEDIWQVEKRFADFPTMAYLCSFNGIVSNFDHLHIIDCMEKYLPPGAPLTCEYIEREGEMYYVNVHVNKVSLKETLKKEAIITEICQELRLDLLAGQQIRAKISSIKDMLNFKIQIEGFDENIKLLCSYDDVRYVKSNPDVAQKFKKFYEGKSCVINIKEVNDNKVILLRPLLPLFKDDLPTYICSYPIILESFDVRVVYVASPYRLYGQIVSTEMEVAQLLDDMYAHYEKENASTLKSFEIEQICAAKGTDDNWYRARIAAFTKGSSEHIEVYYIDYGNTEKLEKTKLKRLDEKFYTNKSAYAIEINLPLRTLADHHNKNKGKRATDEATTDASVVSELKKLTLDQVLTAKAIEVRRNHFIADLNTSQKKSIVDMLKEKHLIKGRDIEFVHRLLDKDKPNMFEYIETVDLTLEDEDEVEKKQSSKPKTSSPKKKKPTKTEEKVVKLEKPVEKPDEVVVPKEPTKPVEVIKATETHAVAVEPILPTEPSKSPVKAKAPTPVPEPVAEPEPEPEPVPEPVDPYLDMEHAILSHCDNPAQFFVHPQEKIDEVHKLQENLQIVASSLPPLMRVINGAHCISLYSVDKQWYRAKIMDAELMVLQFIDFGNTDCVTDTTDVKEMSVFPDIEPLCMPCALPIKPNGTADWVDAANAIFNDSYNKVLHFEYITRGDQKKRSFINLHIDGVNIAERLVQDGFAKRLELVTSGTNCYISHANGPTDFYIQYEKDSKALELIEFYLAENEKFEQVDKFEHSKIVAALFSDDKMWYRAKLLKEVPPQGYEVLFIDFGNTAISQECREISAEIAQLPPLSKKCALELPDNCLSWSDAAEVEFAEIAALGETIFTVELRQPAADHALVHLLIDGHNINDDLEPLCEHKPVEVDPVELMNASFCNTTLHTSVCESGTLYEAIISHANSPLDFYVQFNKDGVRLEDMTNTLNSLGMDALPQPEVGQLCAAVFDEDKALYRAKILEIVGNDDSKQYRVIFIDFGNESLTTDLRILPQDLQQLKEFSKHCQLENSSGFAQHPSIAAETFNALIDACEGLVKVDLLDADVEPVVVKLYAANTDENMCEKLNTLLGLDGTSSSIGAASAAVTENAKACLISHAFSPSHFYIQLKANSSKMELVSKALLKPQAEQLPELVTAEVGRVCSVYSTEDDCYYRGRVESVLCDDAGYEIFLLDYGNSLVATMLRELPQELLSIPALALKCTLNAVPSGISESLLEDHFAALLDVHFGDIYEIESDEVNEETRLHTVKLQVHYKDLAEELAKAVKSGSKPVDALSPLPTLHNCTIIHVNSPASFYIQLSADVSAVEQITDVLLDAEANFKPFADLQVGAICAAQFPEDLAYYRAQIVQVLEDGKCDVHYLDFGNNSVTDQFRELPENMLNIAGYSKHCSLDVNFSTAEASAHFQALIDSRFSETFQVEFLKTTADPQICRLFYQDKNVANEVTALLKGGVACANATAANPSSGVSSMEEEAAENDVAQ